MAKTFDINDLAGKLGIQPGSARVALRNAGIKTTEGRYSWKDKAALEKVVDKLNTVPSSVAKVAKKSVAKTAVRKSTKKSAKKSLRRAA